MLHGEVFQIFIFINVCLKIALYLSQLVTKVTLIGIAFQSVIFKPFKNRF